MKYYKLTRFNVFDDPYEIENKEVKLEILDKYGKASAITDFSILLGGYVSDDEHTKEGTTDKDRAGNWWLGIDMDDVQEYYLKNIIHAINTSGNGAHDVALDRRDIGARPAIIYSSIKPEVSNEIIDDFGVKEVEYGEYPQTIVDEIFSNELEESLNSGMGIRKTGRTYTTDSVDYDDYDTKFTPRKHEEYEYKGKRYIRIIGDCNGEGEKLSDGRIVEEGKPYWVAVEPIKWLVDEKANIALTKKILFAGVQFDWSNRFAAATFYTTMSRFTKKYFLKEIVQKENDKIDLIENPVEEQNEYDGRLKKGFGINKAFAEISLEELDELRNKLDLVPEGTTERENLEAVYKWICDYYENNYKKILNNKNTVEVATYREVVNNFTLDLDRVLYSSFNETNNNDLYMDVSSYGDESNNRGLRM